MGIFIFHLGFYFFFAKKKSSLRPYYFLSRQLKQIAPSNGEIWLLMISSIWTLSFPTFLSLFGIYVIVQGCKLHHRHTFKWKYEYHTLITTRRAVDSIA